MINKLQHNLHYVIKTSLIEYIITIMSKKSNTTIPHGTGKPSTHSTYTIHQSPEIHGEMPRFSNVPPPPSPKKK